LCFDRGLHLGPRQYGRDQHPISAALPVLARYLDMPAEPLPGDWSTPRVQSPRFGASERLAFRRAMTEGYLHMPGGQSGHPLAVLPGGA
jgi:penicillin amidase